MIDFVGKKVLVTGGTGLIGRQVVKLLCDAGANVTSVSMDVIIADCRANQLFMNLCSFSNCLKATVGMYYVFHLAGIKGSPKVTREKPASFFVPMLKINTNVLEACRINNVKGVVYTSSVGAYPQREILEEKDAYEGVPMDTYPGWAKRMAEFQIQTYEKQYGLKNFGIVRLTNVYGEGDNFDIESAMVIPALMAKIRRGDNPVKLWGNGTEERDFLYSGDCAEGIIQVMQYGLGQGVINLGNPATYTIENIVDFMHEIINFNHTFDGQPPQFRMRVMNCRKAELLFKYAPNTYIAEGLKRTWDWFNEHSKEYESKQNYFKEKR